MAIQYMDLGILTNVLVKAWQKATGDGSDPANGQWYTTGANGDNIGLYGGLTDAIDSVASVGAPTYDTDPGSLKQKIILGANIDNSNGLLTMPSVTTLSHTYSTTQTFTHTSTSSIRVGVAQQYQLHIQIPGASIGASTTISFDKTWTTSDSTADSTTNSSTFSQSVSVLPPKGKIYQPILTFYQNKATVPYWLNLHCGGETETWYENRVNGHYNWANGVATLIGQLTAADYTALGLDPSQWGVDGNGVWTKGMAGTLTVDLIGTFNVSVIDVTGQPAGFLTGQDIDAAELSKMIVPPLPAGQQGGRTAMLSRFLENAARDAAAAIEQPWRARPFSPQGPAGHDQADIPMATQEVDGCGEPSVDNCPPAETDEGCAGATQQEGCTEDACPTQGEGCAPTQGADCGVPEATEDGCGGGEGDITAPPGNRMSSARSRTKWLA